MNVFLAVDLSFLEYVFCAKKNLSSEFEVILPCIPHSRFVLYQQNMQMEYKLLSGFNPDHLNYFLNRLYQHISANID